MSRAGLRPWLFDGSVATGSRGLVGGGELPGRDPASDLELSAEAE